MLEQDGNFITLGVEVASKLLLHCDFIALHIKCVCHLDKYRERS